MVHSARNTWLPTPQFTFVVKFQGQIQSNFSVSLLWPTVSQQPQKSEPIELKFGMKEHERGQVLHVKFRHDRRRGGWVSKPHKVRNFIKIAVLASIFLLPSARLCTNRDEMWHETIHCRHAKFELNRRQGVCRQVPPNFGFRTDLELFSVFTSSQPTKRVRN